MTIRFAVLALAQLLLFVPTQSAWTQESTPVMELPVPAHLREGGEEPAAEEPAAAEEAEQEAAAAEAAGQETAERDTTEQSVEPQPPVGQQSEQADSSSEPDSGEAQAATENETAPAEPSPTGDLQPAAPNDANETTADPNVDSGTDGADPNADTDRAAEVAADDAGTEPEVVEPAEPKVDKRLTIMTVAEAGPDFQDAGEYQGAASTNGRWQQHGLQVVALGQGQFGGMWYRGGLPGTGWDRQHRQVLSGKRDGDQVVLSTEDGQHFTVGGGRAYVGKPGEAGRSFLPRVARRSPTLGMPAPANAFTLFDGHDTNQFQDGRMTEDGLLVEGTELIHKFDNFTLHVEYRLPFMPNARGQARSNSGIYLLSSYEVQILDSFGLEGVENQCGALYRYRRPDLNMCLPPLAWQTYDITFRSPKFDSQGKKTQNARLTVLHNGVAVHNRFEVERKTGAGKPESPKPRPIKFQDHSNPVRFRNIWLIDLTPAHGLNM